MQNCGYRANEMQLASDQKKTEKSVQNVMARHPVVVEIFLGQSGRPTNQSCSGVCECKKCSKKYCMGNIVFPLGFSR